MHKSSFLGDPVKTLLVIAILVKRLGGAVNINQSDIDEVAYGKLMEDGHEDGSFSLFIAKEPRQQ